MSCSEIEWKKKYVGIFDNDQAGQKDIQNGFSYEESERRIKFVKHKDANQSSYFFAILLPKPEDYKDKSYTIENCYDSSKYEEAFNMAMEEKRGHFMGLSIDTISDNLKNKAKTILANNAKSFPAHDFDGFRPMFELLDKIRQLNI